jgi:hypothetical protein
MTRQRDRTGGSRTVDLAHAQPWAVLSRQARPSRFTTTGPTTAVDAGQRRLPALPVVLFMIGFVVPWVVQIGALSLSMSRLVLLVMIVPCLLRWASGKAGPVRLTDFIVLGFCHWSCIAIGVVHGFDRALNNGGMLFIETAGAYFLARSYILTAADFRAMVLVLFWLFAAQLPLALAEGLTGRNVAMEAFGALLPTYHASNDGVRWGIKRVQGVFEHPILFGVCIGGALALTHLVLGYGKSTSARWLRSSIIFATAFLSMSSGPYSALAAQMFLIGWAHTTGRIANNWLILLVIGILIYLGIELGSNQSFMQFYVSKFSFDASTGWLRLLIWDYGTASVANHLWFGVGYGEWAHPTWMSDSMDMFWLLNAVRFGLPAGALMLALPIWAIVATCRAKGFDHRTAQYRLAYLIAVGSFLLVGWTVHFWGAAYACFLFVIGSGVWIQAAPMTVRARQTQQPVRRRGGAFATALNPSPVGELAS